MANRREEPEFTVTDRRRFSDDGEQQPNQAREEDKVEEKAAPGPAPVATASPEAHPEPEPKMPPRPTDQERTEGSRAYKESTEALDAQLKRELGSQLRGDEFNVTFDRIIEPLYVTALMQLGFMGQDNQAQRRVDIIGARQSIDALAMLQEKTKGNLTETEKQMLEDVIYDIRMKYLEITNALARAVQNPPAGGGPNLPKA